MGVILNLNFSLKSWSNRKSLTALIPKIIHYQVEKISLYKIVKMSVVFSIYLGLTLYSSFK